MQKSIDEKTADPYPTPQCVEIPGAPGQSTWQDLPYPADQPPTPFSKEFTVQAEDQDDMTVYGT